MTLLKYGLSSTICNHLIPWLGLPWWSGRHSKILLIVYQHNIIHHQYTFHHQQINCYLDMLNQNGGFLHLSFTIYNKEHYTRVWRWSHPIAPVPKSNVRGASIWSLTHISLHTAVCIIMSEVYNGSKLFQTERGGVK